MKTLLILIICSLSLFSLTLEESKHLLNRTSFGYSSKDLKIYSNLSKEEAVNYLIKEALQKDIFQEPSKIKELSIFNKKFKNLSKEERKNLRKQKNRKMQEIKVWWYKMMLESKYSFREKMTLFWHNHFVSEYKVVKSPYLMFKQNMLYRDNALGKFDELLYGSSKDLAMLIYLDNNSNKKSHPNENYARELLELFTLGEGNYSEEDIKEAARAFTGLRVNKRKAIIRLVKKQHDFGKKSFLNESGNFNGDDIIRIILKQEQTARFITYKLYKEFINEEVNEKLLTRLSNIFKDSNYDIAVLMKNILLSDEFWANKNNMIKSPIEMIVSMSKHLSLDIKDKEYRFILKSAKSLGQDLFNPPSVQGWIGGKLWIDSTSLVNRKEFILKVLNKKLNKKSIKKLNFDKSKKEYVSTFTNLTYQIK